MAILEQVKVEPTVNRNRPFAGFAQERPRAKVWLNFGIMDGDEFIPLPLGSPIDTMEPVATTGTNVEFVKRSHKKNKVLKALQDMGAKMAAGEEKEVVLVCRLRRVNDELEIVRNESDLDMDGIVDMLTPKVKETKAETPVQPEQGPTKAELQAQLKALQKALKAAE